MLFGCKINPNFYAGLLVLAAGGCHIAWLLWNLSRPEQNTEILFLQFSSWYFGNIIGCILGAVLVTKWQKKYIYVRLSVITFIVFANNMYFIINCSIYAVQYQQ